MDNIKRKIKNDWWRAAIMAGICSVFLAFGSCSVVAQSSSALQESGKDGDWSSNVTWQYTNNGTTTDFSDNNAVTYNGYEYTVQIKAASLPAGVSVASYGGTTAATDANTDADTDVNTEENYTTTVTLTGDSKGDTTLTLHWTIEPASITLSWTTEEQTDRNGFKYDLPVLDNNSDKVDYTYYESDEDGTVGEKISQSDLRVKVTKGYYLARVTVKSEYAQNYKLVGEKDTYLFSIAAGNTLSGGAGANSSTDGNTIGDGGINDGEIVDNKGKDNLNGDGVLKDNGKIDGMDGLYDGDTQKEFPTVVVVLGIIGGVLVLGCIFAILKIKVLNKKK